MAQSMQESVVSSFSRFSFGAAYLFEPTTLRKGGGGVREPADLAWASDDSVILLNLQVSRKPAAKQDAHNRKQMSGWLRTWHSGVRLTGRNRLRYFRIAPDDVINLVTVSVVQANDAFLEVRVPRAAAALDDRSLTPNIDATVPDAVLRRLGELGGTALDFVQYLKNQMQTDEVVLSQSEALQKLTDQFDEAKSAAISSCGGPAMRDADFDNLIYRALVSGMRSQPGVNWQNTEDLQRVDGLEMLNDLDWESTLQLVYSASAIVRSVRDIGGPSGAFEVVEVAGYRFAVEAVMDHHLNKYLPYVTAEVNKLRKDQHKAPPVQISFIISGRPVINELATIVVGHQQPASINITSLLRS